MRCVLLAAAILCDVMPAILCDVTPALLTERKDYCELECQDKLDGIQIQHLLCGYSDKTLLGPKCGEYGATELPLDEDEKRLLVRDHNHRRSRVARGEEVQGSPGPQPPAAGMGLMRWDAELALIARRWAMQCEPNDELDNCRDLWDYKVGQSSLVWCGDDAGVELKNPILTQLHMWYKEVLLVAPPQSNRLTRHYRQMVWDSTTRLGCARMLFTAPKRCHLLVCMYAPAASDDEQVYEVGKHCSSCVRTCSDTFPGLCTRLSSKPLTANLSRGIEEYGNGGSTIVPLPLVVLFIATVPL